MAMATFTPRTGQKRPLLNVILPKAMLVEAIDLFSIVPEWLNSSAIV
ncbi:hypothetical protein KTJ34_13260 [Acinetobacter courvalinii]|nr:hypothetical protein [Acinetobacter courvalinii]